VYGPQRAWLQLSQLKSDLDSVVHPAPLCLYLWMEALSYVEMLHVTIVLLSSEKTIILQFLPRTLNVNDYRGNYILP
jgi:hypothetical protein